MKITGVEPILIEVPLKQDGPLAMSGGSEARRSVFTLLVKVDTDDGITGFGEAFGIAGARATHAAIEHIIAPRCIGRDPSDIASLMQDLHRRLHSCGRSGPVVYGISGIDIALWDIAAKAAGLPLYRLLGGCSRESLPAYASLSRYGDIPAITRQIGQALDRGYRLIKVHENKFDTIRAARQAAGPDIPLMVDCSRPWNLDEALDILKRLGDLNLTFIEEPLYPADDYAGLARLRAASSVPIAAGENISNVAEFKRMFEAEALSFAQPSITKIGGVSELRKIFAVAESFGVPVVPHSPYYGPGFLASVHACAAFAKQVWIERYYADFEIHPFDDAIHPQRGEIIVPQGAGLGRDPDPAIVKKLRIA